MCEIHCCSKIKAEVKGNELIMDKDVITLSLEEIYSSEPFW